MPYIDADGDPLDPTTPDTEISIDAATFTDTAEEVTPLAGARGMGYLTLSGAETNGAAMALWAGAASGPKATLMTLYPRVLPTLETGTAQAGAAGTITLAAGAAAYSLIGCIVQTTGGTGGGGTGGANNQARVITAYNTSTKVATVVPNWEVTPSSDTTYNILMTDMAGNALLGRFLRSTTDGVTLDVTATGAAGIDWGNVENPTTTVGLTGTTVDLVANAVDATAIATDAITAAKIATGAITAAKFAAGAITATVIATDAIDADALAADALAEINLQVVDGLNVDTYAEPGQGTPAATLSLAAKINYIYKFLRNKVTSTSTTISIFNDDAATVDQKSTHSDDGTTYTRGEFTTGP